MATATHTMIDPRERSLELAREKGHTSCSHAARTLGWTLDAQSGALVSLTLEITSATSDAVYAVTYNAYDDDATCDCPGARYGRHGCWHRGLGILCGREVARCYTPAGRRETLHEQRQEQRTACTHQEFDIFAGQRGAVKRAQEEW